MLRVYEAWEDSSDDSVSLSSEAEIERQRLSGTINEGMKLLYKIEAHTFEEASSIHHLRMGWGNYNP